MTRTEITQTLAPAVRAGLLSMKQARAWAVLFGSIKNGNPADPDGGTPRTKVRGAGNIMTRLKKNSDPATVKGRAAVLVNGARVKDASERLSRTKSVAKRPDGRTVERGGKPVEHASDYEKGVIGVWWKHKMHRAGVPGVVLTEWEKSLLAEVVTKGRWVGDVPATGYYYGGGSSAGDYAPTNHVKALLDDTVSGGLYLNPVEFDENIITYPLLHSEILPLVDIEDVTGRRVITPTMANMGVTWGTAPGSAVTPYNTANLVGAINTAVYPVTGAIELDNYLLADSPVAIGAKVTELYGEKLKAELDRVIVAGNGTSEPLGITLTSGLVSVNSDYGTGGPPTVSDYESLIFSVGKQYRQKEWNPAFLANDTTYRRSRQIPVGPADERRVFGMDHQSYQLLDYPFKVQNDVTNNRIIFGCWKRYRLFRRLGSEVVMTREGRALTLSNTTLIAIRARFGGQPIDANAFALMQDAQS